MACLNFRLPVDRARLLFVDDIADAILRPDDGSEPLEPSTEMHAFLAGAVAQLLAVRHDLIEHNNR